MKKVLKNKTIIAVALFTVFTVALNPVAMAKDIKPTVPVELKFVGKVNEKTVFQLNFTGSPQENEFTITITDEEGNRLYREVLKGENFSKRYLLNAEEIGDNTLRFEVSSNKTTKPAVFKVNREARLVEEVVVNKLN
jgi:methionine-rich copper-binding protein CopC